MMPMPRMKFTLKSATSNEGAKRRQSHRLTDSVTNQNSPCNSPAIK